MTNPEPTIRIPVDLTNPGQFFACCGLLELADRLWGGAEGWFSNDGSMFHLRGAHAEGCSIAGIIERVARAGLVGELTPALQQQREAFETEKRQLKKEKKNLPVSKEARRKELGLLLREGTISIGEPFNLRLNWWQEDGDDIPKTWAGRQEVLRIARAMQAALSRPETQTETLFDLGLVVFDPLEPDKKVEPFYFDSRRGANAQSIDIGFAPDSLEMTTAAYPAVEFLCLVGLQRCRPMPTGKARVFHYYSWAIPYHPVVLPAVVCGLLKTPGSQGYRFENAFRTDQRKYKAFLPATLLGDLQ